ncbi:MAG: formate dehydrogenase iron-sulfur subunit, partial [Chloroflexota bacterium]|nr:formate dehydrogenase iron-sulfur subunit [Chloroflexota bacterium]
MTHLLKTPKAWPSILLERAAASDPTDLDASTRAGAFDGLRRVIRDLGATATTATIAASGLRGRGGAGFPAAVKWRTAAGTEAARRYVVVNGYGADPATGTDRYLLEHDPFAVIEGAAIAAFS